MKTDIVGPGTAHRGFERKELVLGILAPEQMTWWICPSPLSLRTLERCHSLEKNVTVSQQRPNRLNLRGMLSLPPGGGSQGQKGKLLEGYTVRDSLQKFHHVGVPGESGHPLHCLDYFSSPVLSFFVFLVFCQGPCRAFS